MGKQSLVVCQVSWNFTGQQSFKAITDFNYHSFKFSLIIIINNFDTQFLHMN